MRIAILAILALAFGTASYCFPPLGVGVGLLCLVCAFIDMGMNGGHAEFAPINLAISAIGFGSVWLAGGFT